MYSLDSIFTGFGLTMYAIIIVYYISAKKDRDPKQFGESRIWIYGGVGYILMLIFGGTSVEYRNELIYIFLFSTFFLSLLMLKRYFKHAFFFPYYLLTFFVVFSLVWLIYSYQANYKVLYILMPIIYIQCIAFFFIGLLFLIHDNYDMSMRNLSGLIFLMLTLVKLFYLVEVNIESGDYLYYIYRIDLFVYILLTFVIVLFDYNKAYMLSGKYNRRISDAFNQSYVGIIQLNSRGDVISMNKTVEQVLKDMGEERYIHELFNILDILSITSDKWHEILFQLNDGDAYNYVEAFIFKDQPVDLEFAFLPNVEKDGSGRHLTTFNCFILQKRDMNRKAEKTNEDMSANR